MKISDTIDQFKKYMLYSRGLRPKTYKSILATLKQLIEFSKTEEIKCFDSGCIRVFLQTGMAEKLWKPKTVHNHWQNLKSYLDWTVTNKIIRINPVIGIEKPKIPKSLPRSVTREDIMRFICYAEWQKWTYQLEKTRNEAIIMTLLFSGLRLQELLDLKVGSVNIDDGNIFVINGKGSKDRVVPIHPQLAPKLRAYFKERQEALNPSQWFFTGIKSDKKLNQKDVQRILNVISNASGVKVTAHMLRHTFGKLTVEGGYSIYKLKEIMGHEQVTTTQKYVSISLQSIKDSFNETKII